MAGAHLVEPGERVLVTGGVGIVEAVEERGATAVHNDGTVHVSDADGGFDAVIVGLDRSFDYQRLAAATSAIHGGARLIGTNADPTYPTPHGFEPGGGSIVAAVATAGETTPVFGGKPHRPMADIVASLLSTPDAPFDPSRAVMVGDRLDTDGLMAATIGCRFALVRSGATAPDAALDHGDDGDRLSVDLDVADLASVADAVIGGTSRSDTTTIS